MEEIPDRFFEEERLERFRRRLPLYRQEEYFQEYDIVQAPTCNPQENLVHLRKDGRRKDRQEWSTFV